MLQFDDVICLFQKLEMSLSVFGSACSEPPCTKSSEKEIGLLSPSLCGRVLIRGDHGRTAQRFSPAEVGKCSRSLTTSENFGEILMVKMFNFHLSSRNPQQRCSNGLYYKCSELPQHSS